MSNPNPARTGRTKHVTDANWRERVKPDPIPQGDRSAAAAQRLMGDFPIEVDVVPPGHFTDDDLVVGRMSEKRIQSARNDARAMQDKGGDVILGGLVIPRGPKRRGRR